MNFDVMYKIRNHIFTEVFLEYEGYLKELESLLFDAWLRRTTVDTFEGMLSTLGCVSMYSLLFVAMSDRKCDKSDDIVYEDFMRILFRWNEINKATGDDDCFDFKCDFADISDSQSTYMLSRFSIKECGYDELLKLFINLQENYKHKNS